MIPSDAFLAQTFFQMVPLPQNPRTHIGCRYWVGLTRAAKRDLLYQTLGSRGLWGGSVNTPSGFRAQWNGLTSEQIISRIDAYCLSQAVAAQRGSMKAKLAGDISPTPQGGQWLGVAALAGLFGFFYWGLRQESPDEREAYATMKARGNPGPSFPVPPAEAPSMTPLHIGLFAGGAAVGAYAMHRSMKNAATTVTSHEPTPLTFPIPPGLSRQGDFLVNEAGVRTYRVDPTSHRVFNVVASGPETPVYVVIDSISHPAELVWASA